MRVKKVRKIRGEEIECAAEEPHKTRRNENEKNMKVFCPYCYIFFSSGCCRAPRARPITIDAIEKFPKFPETKATTKSTLGYLWVFSR